MDKEDRKEKKEEQEKDNKEEGKKKATSNLETKKLLMVIAVIIGVFALGFLLRFVYSPEEGPTTIDEFHKKNLEGEESEFNYLYNGFSFVYVDNMWYTQVQRHSDNSLVDIPLHYGPRDLENISISGAIDKGFQQPIVYITIDPEDRNMNYIALASSELSLNLAKGIGVVPKFACSKNKTDTCKTRPILDCDNTDKAIIYLQQSNNTGSVNLEGNCIEIKGNNWELVKAVDRLLLQWYQVMK